MGDNRKLFQELETQRKKDCIFHQGLGNSRDGVLKIIGSYAITHIKSKPPSVNSKTNLTTPLHNTRLPVSTCHIVGNSEIKAGTYREMEFEVFLVWKDQKLMVFENNKPVIEVPGWVSMRVSEINGQKFSEFFNGGK